MGLIDTVPVERRKLVKQSAHYRHPELTNTVHLKIDNTDVDLSLVTSKSLYKAFKMAKQTPPSAQKRFQDQFPDVQFDWNEIYLLSFKVSLEMKVREFQYKVLNNIVFTNEKVFKMSKIDLPQCTFCRNEIESLDHLFYSWEITGSLWVALCSWLMECNFKLEPLSVVNVWKNQITFKLYLNALSFKSVPSFSLFLLFCYLFIYLSIYLFIYFWCHV